MHPQTSLSYCPPQPGDNHETLPCMGFHICPMRKKNKKNYRLPSLVTFPDGYLIVICYHDMGYGVVWPGGIYKLALWPLIILFDLLSADDIKISLHFLSTSGWAMEEGGNREWPGWWQELE